MKGMPGCPQPVPSIATRGACSQMSWVRIQLCSLVAISPQAIYCIILLLSFLLCKVGVVLVSTLCGCDNPVEKKYADSAPCSAWTPQIPMIIKNIHLIYF